MRICFYELLKLLLIDISLFSVLLILRITYLSVWLHSDMPDRVLLATYKQGAKGVCILKAATAM